MNEKNYAFIDGQNLYLGTQEDDWAVSHPRLRQYLRSKYKVNQAFYFLGYVSEDNQDLYSSLQKAGFIVVFKEHVQKMLGKKKGNVDTDLVFEVMKALLDEKEMDKIVLVSGDGDYKKMVDYLISKDKFKKILFPNRKFASSLYNSINVQFKANLNEADVKKKIEYDNNKTKEKASLGS